MAFYHDVKPGDPFKPSARLSNDVRHFFNGVQGVSAGRNIKSEFFNNNRVAVINDGTTVLPAHSAIYVYERHILGTEETGFDLELYAKLATGEQLLWGVTETDIEPNGMGMMVISGIAQAYISGSGNYASPGADGKLVAGSSGKALILHPGDSDSEIPGIVQLGYSGGAIDDYTGPFKLRHVEGRTFEICHGSYFDRPQHSDYQKAGNTDLPGATLVPRQNIILPENRTGADVYLHAIYEDGKYRVEFDFDSYRGFETIYIGVIRASGEVVQEYQEQGTIYFGRQWYL